MSLIDDEVNAVNATISAPNGLIGAMDEMNAEALPAVDIPQSQELHQPTA